MNKEMKWLSKVITCLMLALLVCSFTACGSKESSIESKLVGTWVDEHGREMEFFKGGSFQYAKGAMGEVSGDYKCVSETDIELTANGSDLWEISGIHEFSLDGETLELGWIGTFTKK